MALNIPLYDGYRLLSDTHNFILASENNGRITHEKFCSTIEGVLQEFISMKIKEFDSTSVHNLLESIKTLQAGLSKALQPLNLVVVSGKEQLQEDLK